MAQSDVGSGGQQQATSLPPAVSHLGKRRQEGSDGGSIGKEAKEEEGHDEEEERDEEREAVAVFLVKVREPCKPSDVFPVNLRQH